jgi:lysophospholipase L1-like esterase
MPVQPLSLQSQGISYAAFGDSLAVGLSASMNYGYVYQYHDWLMSNVYGGYIALNNLGRSGWTSTDLLNAINGDASFRNAIQGASIITVNIGGNDLRRANYDEGRLNHALSVFQNSYPGILYGIRSLNPSAIFYTMDIYNPYPPGHVNHSISEKWIGYFNNVIYGASGYTSGVAMVYDAFRGHEGDYVANIPLDDYHANTLGHSVIRDSFISVTS